jgi:colanic acid/amylovoran biosynthesis glycosyltransferase
MDIFLFTNFFPYKRPEQFLKNECLVAMKFAGSVSALALYGEEDQTPSHPGITLAYSKWVLHAPLKKRALLWKGIVNLAPLDLHLREFFRMKVFLNRKKLRYFFTSLLVTRATLSSSAFRGLLAMIKKSDHPVLYFYWGDNLAWVIPYLSKYFKVVPSIVLRLHGSDLYEWVKCDYAPLRQKIFAAADVILAVSANGQKYLSDKYPVAAHKISIGRLGVFDRGTNPSAAADAFVVVSVSNLVPLKRVELILEALNKTKGKFRWYHFGEGPRLEKLQKMANGKRELLETHISGSITNEQLIEFYRINHVDLFINASLSEGIPVSIMEAFSFGIPVIAPAVGGIPELLEDKKNGLLLPAGFTAETLALAIGDFRLFPESQIDLFRKNARISFEKLADAERNYVALYQQLLKLSDR